MTSTLSDYAQVTLFNKRFVTLLIEQDFNQDDPENAREYLRQTDNEEHYCIEDKTEVSHPLRVTLSLLGRKILEAVQEQNPQISL